LSLVGAFSEWVLSLIFFFFDHRLWNRYGTSATVKHGCVSIAAVRSLDVTDFDGESALHVAVHRGWAKDRCCLPNQCEYNYGDGVLYYAAEDGNAEAVQLLLPVDGIDVNMADENSATPLFLASAHGHTDIAPRLLANWRVDPSAPDDREQWMPLYAAARKSHVDVVKQLASCDGVLQWYRLWAANEVFQ
jgi:Ankyrin repeats (3 copies)